MLLPFDMICVHLTVYVVRVKSGKFLLTNWVIILLDASTVDVEKKCVLGVNMHREYGVSIGYENVITSYEDWNNVVRELLKLAWNSTAP